MHNTPPPPPFYIDKQEEQQLRIAAERLSPSLVIQQATSFDDYVRQFMIPTTIMELARKAAQIRLSTWEVEGIRAFLAPHGGGILRYILEKKAEADRTHPPYIRVACTGEGRYDKDAREKFGYDGPSANEHQGDFGSAVVLEIWPAQHYSPIHSHGDTTGIIYCLHDQLDVMAYSALDWNARKVGLVTLTPGQCAWLAGDRFAVHKVYCPSDGGAKPVGPQNLLNDSSNFGASFHVYVNESELNDLAKPEPKDNTRDIFKFVNEAEPHNIEKFTTHSDLSWSVLRRLLAAHASKMGL